MYSKNIKVFIILAIITVAALTIWVISLFQMLQPGVTEWDESRIRFDLSDEIGFIKSNWDNLKSDELQKELSMRFKASSTEVLLYDNLKQEVVFTCGEFAEKAAKTNIGQVFGLTDRGSVDKGNYRHVTWLIFDQDTLLGIAKLYISSNAKNVDFISIRLKVILSGIGLVIGLLCMWMVVMFRILKRKQKLIHTLNNVTKNLSQGAFDVPIAITEETQEIEESMLLFDRMRQDLKEMILAKEEYEESRKTLVNYLMHDIRTPVASMRVLTEGLIDGMPKTEEAKNTYYEGLKNKITELERLTDDLFHHMNIEAGAMVVKLEEVYCDEAMIPVFSWLNTFKNTFSGSFEVDYNIPHVLVKLDAKRMEQALVNLITNSIKYSRENSFIKVKALREENMVVFQVEDDGIGISKEDLPFIFEHFFRGEKSRSRRYGGSGLGLSIVKYIVEAHGGYITVKSQLGTGSVFRVFIPLV